MNKNQLLITVIIAVIIFGSGYYLGKKKTIVKETVKYEKRESIKGGVPSDLLKPTIEFEGSISNLPNYYFIDNTQAVDTSKIIADFMKIREYNFTLFDNNELGKLDLKPTLQFNKLISLDYDFQPRQKVVTRTIERTFQPFLSVNYHTIDVVGVGGGFFYQNLGLEYLYNRSLNNATHNYSFHTIGIKYKF